MVLVVADNIGSTQKAFWLGCLFLLHEACLRILAQLIKKAVFTNLLIMIFNLN